MALRLLDDNPLDGPLRPGLHAVAERLAELLPGIPATSPVLVSGDWGSGKTSLLRSVKTLIDAPFLDETDRTTVWFDAWHHEGESGLLPALMRRVWEAAPPAYRRSEIALGLFAKVSRFAIALGVRALPVAATALGLGPAVQQLTSGMSAFGLAGDAGAIPAKFDEPPPDAVEELRASFARLVREAWRNRAPTILIDDLDRCSPDGAVALLDAVRMLISGAAEANCRFVVALDRGVVVEAISAKFEKIRGYDGNRYLEKLFPLEFHVPHPSRHEADLLVKEMLFGEPDERNRLALNQVLSEPLFANPRLMKRCINRFRLVRHFEQSVQDAMGIAAAGGTSESKSDQVLATWISATERWPQLRVLMRTYDNAGLRIVLEEFESTVAEQHIRPEVRALRLQPALKEWTRRTELTRTFLEYRAADERLRIAGL